MSALADPAVWLNGDGTYTIVAASLSGRVTDNWTLRDTGAGWEAVHPGCCLKGILFATAEDAAEAVIGFAADAVLFDGRRYAEVYG